MCHVHSLNKHTHTHIYTYTVCPVRVRECCWYCHNTRCLLSVSRLYRKRHASSIALISFVYPSPASSEFISVRMSSLVGDCPTT